MHKYVQSTTQGNLRYYHTKYPPTPKLLVVSGLHGDEAGVIEPLFLHLTTQEKELPPTLFIPVMSPSAFERKQRKNKHGNDVNRIFGLNTGDTEEQVASSIVKAHAPYNLVVSFHEDHEYSQVYVYDVGTTPCEPDISSWRNAIHALSLDLLNGIDDPSDADLGYRFEEGYNHELAAKNSGEFEHWVIQENFAPRSLTLEIPAHATSYQKRGAIEATLQHLILPLFP
ncbi:hypothetical protein C5B42_01105 [Candidatus Cerribacteria bacterium 'Amazon FNV 2010 28 9']|uniref:Succinylglutamate desuccinylase/Aspartoacylase catalytic domain-containing protein n=1 Tax=Candidatus Cerribacteria bacterium 'Amazon FNV 2010 28 9' TaxID=2081795 RepID=A0A317JPP5_9BACT|nr:MAG: hypothetical protein C5B42_01105 [Candidatus Cerribacteria bacterium 'Amazon FNV 2010 28 9']